MTVGNEWKSNQNQGSIQSYTKALLNSWLRVAWDGHRFPNVQYVLASQHHNFTTSHLSRQIIDILDMLKQAIYNS